jgi:PAS domain S-box-containing protein
MTIIELLFALHTPPSQQLSTVLLRILFLTLLFLVVLLYQGKPLRQFVKTCARENPELIAKLKATNNVFDGLSAYIEIINTQKKLLVNDLTEHKRIESSLRKSEQRYRNLIETLPDATLLTDKNGSIILNNHRSLAVLGIDNDTMLLQSNIYSFIPEQEHDHFSRIFNQLKRKKQIESFECLMIRKNISLFFSAEVSISATCGPDDEIIELIFIIRDISERKRTELEKAKLEEQFRSIYKMEVIGQLAGGIAHDFNNILGAISGYGDIILLRYQQDERLAKYAGMILSAAGRASDLTKKLLTFSRKSKLRMDSIDVHQIIEETVELLERTIEKNIQVQCNLQAHKPFVIGDASQIQSAIMNLAINSRDAMPEGGEILISTENSVLDEKLTIFHAYSISPGSYLAITIQDTGSGMDQQVLSHLFEPFFTTKDIGKGTGLGLASVYGTIKSHNGYIDVKSEPGKGSTFTMYIPGSEIQTIPEKTLLSHTSKGMGNILVVDDEAVIREAVKEILSWLGYSVYTCSNGLEAVDFYKNRSPLIDLVILDMIMPGINGKECFSLLKKLDSSVRVILSTGYRIEEDRQSLINDGIIDILQKPFVSAQLAQSVHYALSQ